MPEIFNVPEGLEALNTENTVFGDDVAVSGILRMERGENAAHDVGQISCKHHH